MWVLPRLPQLFVSLLVISRKRAQVLKKQDVQKKSQTSLLFFIASG
jgi:hypothetical protein